MEESDVRNKSIKHVRENIGKTVNLICMENRSKYKQIGLHQTKTFHTMKLSLKQKRHTTELEKIVAHHTSDKELISKLYKAPT